MPGRPTTGSELSLMVFRNMSSSETTGNSSAAHTQYFTENAGLRLHITVSAFPTPPHSDSDEGDCFRGLTIRSELRGRRITPRPVLLQRLHSDGFQIAPQQPNQ